MLDINFIRDNVKSIKENCQKRRVKVDVDLLLKLDDQRRVNIRQLDNLRAERNQKSKSKPDKTEIAKMKKVGEEIKKLEEKQKEIEAQYQDLMLRLPNLTHPKTPIGGENDFKVVAEIKNAKKLKFQPQEHEELMKKLNLVDFERGAKVTGSKFYFYKNDQVRLNLALLNFALDITGKYDYLPVETPDLVKNEVLEGSGFNPRGQESQVYELKNDELSLIGTAEITMLGYHANETLDLNDGPKKYAALSHCFRTEAGAYGKAVKGLYRVHQFTKLELFIFCQPEDSEKYFEELLKIEREICDGLELPYRVIDCASGDLGGPAYRKYDIEAKLVMKDYGEITSCSNCTDYQARRLNVKYKTKDGKTEFVHTLNGTAIVTSRFPLALIENCQQADGSIAIPKALQKYFGKQFIK